MKGWVKVYSYTRPVEQILEYRRWLLAGRHDLPECSPESSPEWRPVRVTSVRRQSKKLLAKLAGVDDCDSSERLTGKWIAISQSQLAELPHGEYYWSDLIGLAVMNQDGVELGVVDHLVETGANDVLVVREDGAGDAAVERLLPWSPQVVVAVDVKGGCIRVQWDAEL